MAVSPPHAIEVVATPEAPAPAGHYSQGLAYGDFVFVSGQLPVRPDGSHSVNEPFEAQARQSVSNMLAIVKASGCRPQDVIKVTVYIVGVEHWPTFNRVYGEAFGAARPARSIVPVPALHHGYLVEVEAVVVRSGQA